MFLPTDCRNAVRAAAASATTNDQTSPKNKKARVFNSALALVGVEHDGPQAESRHTSDFTNRDVYRLHHWVGLLQEKQKSSANETRYTSDSQEAFRPGKRSEEQERISADRAHAIITEDIAAKDWFEQLHVTSRLSSDTRKISKNAHQVCRGPIKCECRGDV
jgi:hypothetical protein